MGWPSGCPLIKKKVMKVKFIKSPIGAFNLAYGEGMEGEVSDNQAEILIEAGYAVSIETPEKPIVESPEKNEVETPEKKRTSKRA